MALACETKTRIRGLSDQSPDTVHVAKSGCVGRGALSIPVAPAADGLKTTDAGGQHSSRKSDGGRALQHCLFCLCIHVAWRVKRAGPKVERIDTMCGIINALDEGKLRVALEGKDTSLPELQH